MLQDFLRKHRDSQNLTQNKNEVRAWPLRKNTVFMEKMEKKTLKRISRSSKGLGRPTYP